MNQQARSAALRAEASGPATLRRRLTGKTIAVRELDDAARRAAFALFAASYEGADWPRFASDLEEKQHIIVMRDHATRLLKGFSTVSVRVEDTERGKAIVVFSGDTVIDREYWGQKELHRQLALLFMRLHLRNASLPIYWFLVSKGYKTYLGFIKNFPVSIPRYERSDDPHLRRLLDRVATARFGVTYDASTGIAVNTGHEWVRRGLAPIDATARANPHVRFFVERNPSHERGDELACLALIRRRDVLGVALRASTARLRKRITSG